MKDHNARVTRWYLALQPHTFKVRHCPGRKNLVANYLSRFPENLWPGEGGGDVKKWPSSTLQAASLALICTHSHTLIHHTYHPLPRNAVWNAGAGALFLIVLGHASTFHTLLPLFPLDISHILIDRLLYVLLLIVCVICWYNRVPGSCAGKHDQMAANPYDVIKLRGAGAMDWDPVKPCPVFMCQTCVLCVLCFPSSHAHIVYN